MKRTNCHSLALLVLVLGSFPTAHAAQEAPAASASVDAAASASAPLAGMPMAAYNWPKEASDKPKDEEWTGATELEAMTTTAQSGWEKMPVVCRVWALREWVRIECVPPDLPVKHFLEFQRFYGSFWGIAGDISGTSAKFPLVSKVEKYAKSLKPEQVSDRLMLNMGASGIVTFRAKYGSATLLRMDQIFWAENYDGGGNVLVNPGILIDVSWALGEKYPTILLNG